MVRQSPAQVAGRGAGFTVAYWKYERKRDAAARVTVF